MNQKPKHTKPSPNSYAAACGHEYSYEDFEFKNMEELMQQDNDEEDLYFYHGDHLGSSSWITDGSGNVNQHLAYMPFGESFIDQRNSHDIRFKFTGKERDSETGFDYFGARYYSSDISVWLSVDPLDFKYPSTSTYMYVGGHPTTIIDLKGMDWYQDKDGNYNYDKNVTKNTKLGKGEIYLGKTAKIDVNGSDGKYSYSYNLNEDGSFSDTKGNSYEANVGEFDPDFESGHTINNNTNKYPSFGGTMFYKEDGSFLYASGKGEDNIIYTIPNNKIDAVMKDINAFDGKSNASDYFQGIADKYSSNKYNTWVLNGDLFAWKSVPWYMFVAIPAVSGAAGYAGVKSKNDGLATHYGQSVSYGIDGTLNNLYGPKSTFDQWW